MAKERKQDQPNPNKSGLKAETVTAPLKIDITPEFYREMKKHYIRQAPRIVRPFINQYFEWLKKLDAGELMDWMESNETLKEIYRAKPFPERVAIAGVRGLLRASLRLKRRAAEAMNVEIACYTLRFENPLAWEVVTAYGDEGMEKLKQAIEDFKEILKLKEEEA